LNTLSVVALLSRLRHITGHGPGQKIICGLA